MTQGTVALSSTSPRPTPAGPLWVVRALLADQRIRFVLTGGANALIAFGIFVVLQHLFTGRWGYMWAVAATYVATLLIGFASHRRLVFNVRGHVLRDLWRFELVHLSSVAVNGLLLAGAVEALHINVVVAQASIVLIGAAYSWFGHSRFTFRRVVTDVHGEAKETLRQREAA